MLTLPIKKKWFDMILSGKKKEEYRERTKYYKGRFFNLFDIIDECNGELINPFEENPEREIVFRNGYSKNSPSFVAKCTLSVGTVEECREARERQWVKKPVKGKVYESLGYYQCPVCSEIIMKDERFCSGCGQAISWEGDTQ